MKPLKKTQLGPWCSYCPPKTTRAVYREDGFAGMFSCESHADDLRKAEESKLSTRVTDADRETWLKL